MLFGENETPISSLYLNRHNVLGVNNCLNRLSHLFILINIVSIVIKLWQI